MTSKTDGFANSAVVADTIKSVFLASLDPTNGGTAFGIFADHTIGSVTVLLPQKLKYPGQTSQGDFEVKVV